MRLLYLDPSIIVHLVHIAESKVPDLVRTGAASLRDKLKTGTKSKYFIKEQQDYDTVDKHATKACLQSRGFVKTEDVEIEIE